MKYYLLAIDKSSHNEFLVWWKPNNWGYTTDTREAGIYFEDTINENPAYYDNDECVPIPIQKIRDLNTIHAAHNNVENLQYLEVMSKYVDHVKGLNIYD